MELNVKTPHWGFIVCVLMCQIIFCLAAIYRPSKKRVRQIVIFDTCQLAPFPLSHRLPYIGYIKYVCMYIQHVYVREGLGEERSYRCICTWL